MSSDEFKWKKKSINRTKLSLKVDLFKIINYIFFLLQVSEDKDGVNLYVNNLHEVN